MSHDTRHTLHQIFSRLCFHRGIAPEQMEAKRTRFISSLACYPEDLLCAAYYYILKHATPSYYPSEEEFILFMAPEYHRRQQAECMEGV